MKPVVSIVMLGAISLSGSAGAFPMSFPDERWEEVSPASQGVDAARLADAVSYLKKNTGRDGVRELVIIRNGRMLWKGDTIDKVHGV